MKAKYLILFLILILVFNFGLGCGGSESKEKIIEEEYLTTEAKTINVKYVVLGVYSTREYVVDPKVSVTYNNAQGGTNQINHLKLINDVDFVLKDLVSSFDFECKECWRGEIIAEYNSLPEDEFLYISAQTSMNCMQYLLLL